MSAVFGIKKPLVNDDTLQEIAEAFATHDVGPKGYLNKMEYKLAFISLLGYKPSKFEMRLLFQEESSSSSTMLERPPVLGVSQEEFVRIMTEKFSRIDWDDRIRDIFKTFDQGVNGFLTLENVQWAFSQALPFVAPQTVLEVFAEIDRDRDGRVSFKDFERMMKSVV